MYANIWCSSLSARTRPAPQPVIAERPGKAQMIAGGKLDVNGEAPRHVAIEEIAIQSAYETLFLNVLQFTQKSIISDTGIRNRRCKAFNAPSRSLPSPHVCS